MLSLIAESKTMTVSPEQNDSHDEKGEKKSFPSPETLFSDTNVVSNNFKPLFQAEASDLNSIMAKFDVSEIAEKLKVTPSLAQKALQLIYDFPYSTTSEPAIKLFSGEVFRALEYNSMSEEEKERFNENVEIISSLYGILRPLDMIKPYRLEFKAEIASPGISMIKYWKPKVTVALGKQLKESDEKEILNILPADASACIDWKLIKAFAKVLKPDFRVIDEKGNFKNPYTGKLKESRGLLLREITEKNLRFKDLIGYQSDRFLYSEELSKTGIPVFIVS